MNLLKTKREALLEPLQAVAGIIERRHTLPILSNVLLSRTDTHIDFVATDIEIEITTSMTVEEPGEAKKITVGARKLVDILRALPVTGMHEPTASHYALMQAFAPLELLRAAHAHAEEAGYLRHEFGDSTLLLEGALARTGRRSGLEKSA